MTSTPIEPATRLGVWLRFRCWLREGNGARCLGWSKRQWGVQAIVGCFGVVMTNFTGEFGSWLAGGMGLVLAPEFVSGLALVLLLSALWVSLSMTGFVLCGVVATSKTSGRLARELFRIRKGEQ